MEQEKAYLVGQIYKACAHVSILKPNITCKFLSEREAEYPDLPKPTDI